MLNIKLLLKMSLKIWIILVFKLGMICPRSSALSCARSYVDGKWISEVDCGGPDGMSKIMNELQLKAEDEKRRLADKDWTVFQRRMYGDVDFYRGWNDYVKGFGNSEGDYWLGLGELHERTKGGNMALEIKMIAKATGIHSVANYSNFQIGPASDNYRLTVSGYTGNASGDSFSYHNNRQFSTYDADHDSSANDCSSDYEGGWWYRSCANSNLNGNFNKTGDKGIWWEYYSNRSFVPEHLIYTEMKFRRIFRER